MMRLLIGAALGSAIVAVLWFDWRTDQQGATVKAFPLSVVIGVMALIAYTEMLRLLKAKGVEVLWISGGFGALALATMPVWWQIIDSRSDPRGFHVLLLLGFLVLFVFFDQLAQRSTDTALLRIAGTVLSMLYIGVGCALVLAIRLAYDAPGLIVFLVAVKATDTGAYFTGVLFGRHKLVPKLSPSKSWEGLIGGLLCGTIAAVVVHALTASWWPFWAGRLHWALWQTAILAAALGLAGQIGDLCESLLKRSAHVKDSGQMLPEFGGVLDMLDSLLTAAPVGMVLLAILD